jgi:hypothetical protein
MISNRYPSPGATTLCFFCRVGLNDLEKLQNFTALEDFVASALLDWRSVCFWTGNNDNKVDLFYSMLFYLIDAFAPKHLVRIRAMDNMCGTCNWLDDRVELAIRERKDSYGV